MRCDSEPELVEAGSIDASETHPGVDNLKAQGDIAACCVGLSGHAVIVFERLLDDVNSQKSGTADQPPSLS
ncbi:hypothetical protein DFQ01_105267 [Paenibacillus cellulosilyticus]|uniref:Uncharacterized protein n=1 Tax=Paenibacillus cellulosilyticus TaxID=375489 RepID=A0A2V2YVP0_9BACL|nr:hypothetical protein DFQ01_105267 [Paenibacillus cellulosilyticus]